MDEVTSKRKDLDSAIRQFDQALQIQSVPIKKASKQSEPSNVTAQSANKESIIQRLDKSPQNSQKVSPEKELKALNILGRKSSDILSQHSRGSSSAPKVLSSQAYKGKINIKKVDFGTPWKKEVEPDKKPSDEGDHIEDEQPITQVKLAGTQPRDDAESTSFDTKVKTFSEEPAKTVFDKQSPNVDTATASLVTPDSDVSDNAKETAEDEPKTPNEKETSSIYNDDIEKRIMAFEEDLALECPICKHSKVTVENTTARKSYYKCSNKECNFISWGKPYHIPCPKCNNPFLIEASNKAGKTILKCPRATCRYFKKVLLNITDNHLEPIESTSQKTSKVTSIAQKPRKRVVRRRVVRRKK